MTPLPLDPLPVPLSLDASGTLRVRDTRIPLERVVHAYLDGASPETIVDWFDTLKLADVYIVVAYYLTHKETVEAYMRQREQVAEEVRRKIEAAQPPRAGLRAELLARGARLEARNAAAG